MQMNRLEVRDLEVLRTLARLRYVTKRELVRAFFPSREAGAHRFRRLADWDLIQVHRKGVSEEQGYHAWRLSPAGVNAVSVAFPDEPMPDGMVDLLAGGRLANLEHRGALAGLYLRLITGSEPPPGSDFDPRTSRGRARQLRGRADRFFWQPDGEVSLRCEGVSFHRRGDVARQEDVVIPDATITSRDFSVRVFVELDRSQNNHRRLRTSMERYRRYFETRYAREFTDGRNPALLVVVPSPGRKAGLEREAGRVFLGQERCVVAEEPQALAWLETQLFGSTPTASGPPAPDALRDAARHVYITLFAYREGLRQTGSDLPQESLSALRRLREEIQRETGGAHE